MSDALRWGAWGFDSSLPRLPRSGFQSQAPLGSTGWSLFALQGATSAAQKQRSVCSDTNAPTLQGRVLFSEPRKRHLGPQFPAGKAAIPTKLRPGWGMARRDFASPCSSQVPRAALAPPLPHSCLWTAGREGIKRMASHWVTCLRAQALPSISCLRGMHTCPAASSHKAASIAVPSLCSALSRSWAKSPQQGWAERPEPDFLTVEWMRVEAAHTC